MPSYVKTQGSIAFPQTVPALRDSSNDLTLGSTSSADTNDGSWRAPIGMIDGGDDQLRAPAKRPQVTWVGRIRYDSTRAWGRLANGWKVTNTDLIVEDESGDTQTAPHGLALDDNGFHTLAVVIDTIGEEARLHVDGSVTANATVDLSQVGTLRSDKVELLPENGLLTHAEYYTRA